VYAYRLLEALLTEGHAVHLVVTPNGQKVFEFETGQTVAQVCSALEKKGGTLVMHDIDDLFASISSGSFHTDGMAVVPCAMATLGEIAAGVSKNLLGRAADVCIKEKRRLVLVPREMPFSTIHLKNMLFLSELGTTILPAAPGFYHHPVSLDDIVNFVASRVLSALGIENNLYQKWR
jgi:4-hydroxy-3-polyprenylbenzoate decarboxylase